MPRSSKLRIARLVDGRAVNFAEREALNGTASAVQRVAIKQIADEMGLQPKDLRKRGRDVRNRASRTGKVGSLPIRRASRRRLVAILQGFGRPFNLTRFNAQEIKSGSRTNLKSGRTTRGKGRTIGVVHEAWGRRQAVLGLFTLPVKGKPVVVREGNRLRGAYGPGVTHVMRYPHIMRALELEAMTEFPKRFAERLRYAMSSGSHVK